MVICLETIEFVTLYNCDNGAEFVLSDFMSYQKYVSSKFLKLKNYSRITPNLKTQQEAYVSTKLIPSPGLDSKSDV